MISYDDKFFQMQERRYKEIEDKFKLMCSYYLSIMEGDTHIVDDAYSLMKEEGIVDEDGFER